MSISSYLASFAHYFRKIFQSASDHQQKPVSEQDKLARRVSELWETPEPLTPTTPEFLGKEGRETVFFSQAPSRSPSPELFSCRASPSPSERAR